MIGDGFLVCRAPCIGFDPVPAHGEGLDHPVIGLGLGVILVDAEARGEVTDRL